MLTIVDIFSRFSPALEPRFTFRGTDVVEVLERACKEVGFPAIICVDQGSEFVSRELDLWAYQRGVTLDFSRPTKPTDNAFIEAFKGRFPAECLTPTGSCPLRTPRKKWRLRADTTTAHQNTHSSMLLKRRDFADWDAIPWGILGSVALVRR